MKTIFVLKVSKERSNVGWECWPALKITTSMQHVIYHICILALEAAPSWVLRWSMYTRSTLSSQNYTFTWREVPMLTIWRTKCWFSGWGWEIWWESDLQCINVLCWQRDRGCGSMSSDPAFQGRDREHEETSPRSSSDFTRPKHGNTSMVSN